MTNYKTKSVIVYDYGTFVGLSERLARDFGKVYYYSPWKSSFPQTKNTYVGKGLENVERINNFFDYLDDTDLIVFPDVSDGDLQLHLEALGYKVFGGRKGEELELNRLGTEKLLTKLGLPVGNYEIVTGLSNLRKYLKNRTNIWVKIDCNRGDFETFKSVNYAYIEPRLYEIECNLGPIKELVNFLCEEDLPDKVELGFDGYSIDGKYPTKTLTGIEIKDLGYIGVFTDYNKLPEPIKLINEKLSPTLKQYGYRGMFSTEVRIGKDKKPYLIDPCMRCGSPPNEVYQEMYTNLSEIMWEGAQGNIVDPIAKGKYAVEVLIHSTYAETHWLSVQIPDKYYNNIKFRNCTKIDDVHYIIPQYIGLPEIGAVTVVGDSIDKCMEQIDEIACEVKGFYIEIPSQSLDQANEEIKKLKDLGYDLYK
jgi:hypothetical protein